MWSKSFSRRWPITAGLFVTFCAQGPSSPTRPPATSSAAAKATDGAVGASADGDVKVGAGALEIVRLRMDRQTSSGVSILRQYANPGQVYAMNPGETIELWAEYPAAVPNPRFKVEWGDGSEADITGCGSCLLKHAYPAAGVYTVRASLDDRVSTTVTRTFQLDSRPVTQVAVNAQCSQPYTSFTSADRNVTFNDGNGGVEFCDLGGGSDWAGTGWYRFTGAAGTMMPETAPPIYACGTDAPGWLSGIHPAVADGVVTRTACFNWAGNTCLWNTSIEVVNCDSFYLYHLVDTTVACQLRYCGTN